MNPHFFDFIRDHLLTLPMLAKFALGMVMLVAIPRICRRLHVPAAVGLLLGGVIIGPYVLGIFSTDRPIADFMAELGKLLLMFFAGLDIDLALFRRARNRSITFGIATTVVFGAWHRSWPRVWLRRNSGARHRIVACITHPARSPRTRSAWH
jgi:hypothetical protein